MNYSEPTEDRRKAWVEFVESRPANVRAVAERFTPWTLYRMKSTGHRVIIVSFSEHEDGEVTLTVAITGQFNLLMFDRAVFGIDPNDLEECDLPASGEIVGTLLDNVSTDEIREVFKAEL